MASNNTYRVTFDANVGQFDANVKKAAAEYKKFADGVTANSNKASAGFESMIKKFGTIAAATVAVKKGFEIFENAVNSTKASQDGWNATVEGAKAGLNTFYQTLATGNWAEFNTNLKNSIALAKDFSLAMSDFKTSKLFSSFTTLGMDAEISELKLQRSKLDKSSQEYLDLTSQISQKMEEKSANVAATAEDAKTALSAGIKDMAQNSKATVEDFLKLADRAGAGWKKLQAAAAENKGLIEASKETKTRTQSGGITGTQTVEVSTAAAIEAQKELELRRESNDLAEASADHIMNNSGKLQGLVETYQYQVQAMKNIKEQQITINTEIVESRKRLEAAAAAERKKVEDSAAAARKSEAEDLARYERDQLLERVKIQLEAYSLQLKKDMTPERYGKVEKIKGLTLEERLKQFPQPETTFKQNSFISDQEIGKYDAIQKKIGDMQQAISVSTQLYGAQSQQVKTLQEDLNKLNDPTGFASNLEKINGFASNLEKVSGALDMISGSSDSIRDNPAIKALAFSLQLLSAVSTLKTCVTPWDYIAAIAGIAASTISFVSSMKDQKFAVGGIAAPAVVGDQANIRVNPGEMILNHNQQQRLFNVINSGRDGNKGNSNVTFRIQGQELVGVFDNYNRKHK
jgi:hypothetical protein